MRAHDGKGGTNDPGNLQALCADCNRGKSDKRVEQMEADGDGGLR